MVRALTTLACLVTLAVAGRAAAWTETQVQSSTAYVSIDGQGEALVRLTLSVRVRGGWLESLELAGLDPDLTLDEEEQPWVRSEEGVSFTPEVAVRKGGRLQLRFPRRASPRRGLYEVGLLYRTSLAHRATQLLDNGRVRVTWTLPGWRTGLDSVEIRLEAPPGATLAHDLDAAAVTSARVGARGPRPVFQWHRAHLPRTVDWTVGVDVPADEMDPGLSQVATAEPEPETRRAPASPSALPNPVTTRAPVAWIIAALVALLALTKRWLFAREARRRGARTRSLLPAPPWLHATMVAGTAALAAHLAAHVRTDIGWSLLALACLLTVSRALPSTVTPALGGFRPANRAELRDARRGRGWRQPSPLAWLSLGSVPGWATLVATALLLHAQLADRVTSLWELAPPLAVWLINPRHALPVSVEERLGHLLSFARRLRLPEVHPAIALMPVVHEGSGGQLQDARLRVVLGRAPVDGLLRLDVVSGLDPNTDDPLLLCLTRAGSDASHIVNAQATPEGVELPGGPAGREARVFPLGPSTPAVLFGLAEALGHSDVPDEYRSTTGCGTARGTPVVVPSPSAPYSFQPKQSTAPVSTSTHV